VILVDPETILPDAAAADSERLDVVDSVDDISQFSRPRS